jgi:hypothetical protein
METDVPLPMRLPTGAVVSLAWRDAEGLVDALWDASATGGAVVAIGRIGHRIARRDESTLELSDDEAVAIRAALADRDDLPSALVGLRDAVLQKPISS